MNSWLEINFPTMSPSFRPSISWLNAVISNSSILIPNKVSSKWQNQVNLELSSWPPWLSPSLKVTGWLSPSLSKWLDKTDSNKESLKTKFSGWLRLFTRRASSCTTKAAAWNQLATHCWNSCNLEVSERKLRYHWESVDNQRCSIRWAQNAQIRRDLRISMRD